jgi:hypothetical protein
MLKCHDCGLIFYEDDLASWQENRGEFWGQPCYETLTGCPHCYSCDVYEYNGDDEERNENGQRNT